MSKKDQIIEYFKSKTDGKLYVLEQRADGLCVIKINGRVSSIHSELALGQIRMKSYKGKEAN